MSSITTKKPYLESDSNNLTTNLHYLMQKNGIDSAALSKSTGIALTTINGLKRGIGNPTLSTLKTLSDFFNVTIGQLTESSISDKNIKSSFIELPLLEIQEVQGFLFNHIKIKSTVFVEMENNNSLFFAVRISNNSMAPLFEKGTIFIVCPEFQPQDGDIVLVQFNSQLPCFRKIFIEDEACIFSPVAEITGNEVSKSKNFVLHGIIIKAIQKFHD